MYYKGLTARLFISAGFHAASERWQARFDPVILNGFFCFFLFAELERQSYFLPYKHLEQIKKEGNVRWKGLTLNHSPTLLALVTHRSGYHSN